jgi:hypothetical protein
MRYENVGGRYFFDVDRFRERVPGDKWMKQQVFPADFGGKAGVTLALIALAPYCLTGAEVAACSMSLAVSFG